MKRQAIAAVVIIVAAWTYACTARQVAKTEYDIQSESCVKIYSGDAPAQKSCLEYVRNKWTKAGAPAAAVDGGDAQ